MLKTIEEFIPVAGISFNATDNVEMNQGEYNQSTESEKLESVIGLYKYFISEGWSHSETCSYLRTIQPGSKFPKIIDYIEEEKKES